MSKKKKPRKPKPQKPKKQPEKKRSKPRGLRRSKTKKIPVQTFTDPQGPAIARSYNKAKAELLKNIGPSPEPLDAQVIEQQGGKAIILLPFALRTHQMLLECHAQAMLDLPPGDEDGQGARELMTALDEAKPYHDPEKGELRVLDLTKAAFDYMASEKSPARYLVEKFESASMEGFDETLLVYFELRMFLEQTAKELHT